MIAALRFILKLFFIYIYTVSWHEIFHGIKKSGSKVAVLSFDATG
jgi:hypothetical protein